MNDYRSPKPPRPWYRKKRWWALGALVVLIVIGISVGASSTSSTLTPVIPVTAASTAPPSIPVSTPATAASTVQAPPPSSAPPATTAPAMTASQQQAVAAAQGYLAMGSGFSYQGLLNQLTSSYGSGFSASDAEFAINYLSPNWDQQAVDAAKGYLATGSGYSAASLTQQLTSSYGSGFTEAQAQYAVNAVGL